MSYATSKAILAHDKNDDIENDDMRMMMMMMRRRSMMKMILISAPLSHIITSCICYSSLFTPFNLFLHFLFYAC